MVSLNSSFRIRVMVFNVTFNNISVISWWSVLLMEETGVPGENHDLQMYRKSIHISKFHKHNRCYNQIKFYSPAHIKCRAWAFLAMTLTQIRPSRATTSTTKLSDLWLELKGQSIFLTFGKLCTAWRIAVKWLKLLLFRSCSWTLTS